jgi:YaaC-like Protein
MTREDPTVRLLRASRAKPPHRAGEDSLRRSIYGASLEQFEQLLKAAEAVGPAARALPMFYALSQAGRAIVAARGEQPEVRGHGLAEDQSVSGNAHLLHRRVKRKAASDGKDAFGAVSRAIGSPEPKASIEIGETWVGLPNTFMVPQSLWQPEWRPVLVPFDTSPRKNKEGDLEVQVASFGGNPHFDERSTIVRGRYPSLPDGTKLATKGGGTLPPGNWIAVLSWEDGPDFDSIAPQDAGNFKSANSGRYIRPTLAGDDALVNPLMLWWVLLFGLSIFARYHPNLWLEALQVESSEIAVPLEAVLDTALSVIPAMVHHELLGI